MNVEGLRDYCLSLPHVKEDIKWESNLCFLIAEKIFCMTALDGAFGASFKVKDADFEELAGSDQIIPAPYLARGRWIYIQHPDRFSRNEWEQHIKQSYDLILAKLPKKIREGLQ